MSNLSLAAHNDAAERRPRKSLLKAATIKYEGVERRVIVRNVSDTGAMIETDLHVLRGKPLIIDIPGHGWRDAIIRWSVEHRAGIEFILAVSLGNNSSSPRLAALNDEPVLSTDIDAE